MAAYQSPWGWDRRSCVVNQAGPGHRRRLLGPGDVALVVATRKVTCFLGVDLCLSGVEVVATRKVTCEPYEWSYWGLGCLQVGKGQSSSMPMT